MIILHIILGILKIIGIVLLILLALVLLTILSLLFAPIRYQVQGEKNTSFYRGNISVSWLFHLFWIKAGYDSRRKKAEYSIRILGISARQAVRFLEKLKKIRRKMAEKRVQKKREKKKKTGSGITAAQEIAAEEKNQKSAEKKSPDKSRALPEPDFYAPTEKEKKSVGKFWEELLRFIKNMLSVPGKICKALRNFQLTAEKICDKIRQIREFWNTSQFQGAKKAVLQEMKKVLLHIKPGKIQGRIAFGTEDPCTTGEILAAAGIFYPLYGENLIIEPYFDKKVLEGNIQAKGRIYGICMVLAAFRLFRNQDIRYIIRKYKQH